MRYQGRLIEWNDERGFGFLVRNGDDRRIFVHINSFSRLRRRPIVNDLLTYEVLDDSAGRPRATHISLVSTGRRSAVPRHPDAALPVVLAFFAFLIVAVLLSRLPRVVAGCYVVLSLLTFIVYGMDKSAAQRKRQRTSGTTLHTLAFIGGWPGALLARKYLRHKSSKRSFRSTLWGTVALNGALLALLLAPFGLPIRGTLDPLANGSAPTAFHR